MKCHEEMIKDAEGFVKQSEIQVRICSYHFRGSVGILQSVVHWGGTWEDALITSAYCPLAQSLAVLLLLLA